MENNCQSFFSMDKLIEFGMGMSIARQMTQSMNEMMANVRVPGNKMVSNDAAGMATQVEQRSYYVAFDGKQAGPFSDTELARLANEHKITKDTLVWRAGFSKWQKAEDTPEILRLVALAPPPLPSEEN